MMRSLAFGVGACLFASGSSFLGFAMLADTGTFQSSRPATTESLARVKLRPVSIPVFSEGQIKGYAVAELGFVGRKAMLDKLEIKPEVFAYDSLFSVIVGSKNRDFSSSLSGDDLEVVRKEVKERVNRGLGAEVVQDVVFESFAFVPLGWVRGQMKSASSRK